MKNLATLTDAEDVPTKAYVDANANPGVDIVDLPALTSAAVGDLVMVLDVSDTTDGPDGTLKGESLGDISTFMETLGKPRVKRNNNRHLIASTTGTEVTDLNMTLEIGTYVFQYALIVQSSLSTSPPMLGVNFTGTGTPLSHFRFADATNALTAEIHSMDDMGVKTWGFISGMASNAKSTTAPNMGTTVGVANINSDILCWIEGIIIVTASGDLELWHSSETAVNTSVEVGSSLIVTRTA